MELTVHTEKVFLQLEVWDQNPDGKNEMAYFEIFDAELGTPDVDLKDGQYLIVRSVDE